MTRDKSPTVRRHSRGRRRLPHPAITAGSRGVRRKAPTTRLSAVGDPPRWWRRSGGRPAHQGGPRGRGLRWPTAPPPRTRPGATIPERASRPPPPGSRARTRATTTPRTRRRRRPVRRRSRPSRRRGSPATRRTPSGSPSGTSTRTSSLPLRRGARTRHDVVARRELPVRRADLPAGQPAAARAAAGRSTSSRGCSATGARRPGSTSSTPTSTGDHRQRDLDAIYVAGPGHGGPGAGRQRLARGHLQRDLPRRHARTSAGMRRLFRQFSFPGGIPSHVAPETPGLDPRGRRARLLAVARLRRRVRQPRPGRRLRRRRRRGRDRAAGDALALATSSSTRATTAPCCRSCTSTATRSPTRPCWPGSRDEELRRAAARLRLRADLGRGRRPDGDAPALAAALDRCLDGIREHPARRAARTATSSGRRWPMIVLRTPKGWTGPKAVDGEPGRGHLARAPGAARRRPATNAGAPAPARGVDALLPARGAVRRRRRAGRRRSRALAPERRAADERQPARQRRPAAARPAAARLPRLRRRRRPSPGGAVPRRPGCWARSCAT